MYLNDQLIKIYRAGNRNKTCFNIYFFFVRIFRSDNKLLSYKWGYRYCFTDKISKVDMNVLIKIILIVIYWHTQCKKKNDTKIDIGIAIRLGIIIIRNQD